MSLVMETRERTYSTPSGPRNFENSPQKRCRSVPPPTSESWVAKEEPYIPIRKLIRSFSLSSRVRSGPGRSLLAKALQPDPVTEERDFPFTSQGNSYDSEEEDRLIGLPITYSQDQLRPFQPSMKYEIEAEFKLLKFYGDGLSATLSEWKASYRELRRHVGETCSLDWTAAQWEEFLFLGDAYFTLQDKLFAVQDRMGQINAQMYLFLDHTRLPSDGRFHDDNTSWSLEGVAEIQARTSEHPILEWNGVDYNHART
ncbi:hypothetical protein F5Y12DRAFT_162899 [Xylaria sp. FL1777]|nr:hypothetical protein F5Y12DRAFT_162899 [Xylaria sp. FL1777]